MPEDQDPANDGDVQKLAEILKKNEDDRQDADWDALGAADEQKLHAAATLAGVPVD